jgi:NAD(P)-dependent dehydrogenase (short-subunit alcohol dehydrogenase family)
MANMTGYLPQFAGRWAIVTGAGDGIGKAFAIGLAECGINIVVADILEAEAQAVAASIQSRGVNVRALAVDVSDRAAMIAAAAGLAEAGIVPALVWANAGVGAGASIIEGSQRAVEWAVAVNILGIAWTAQAFLPRLIALDGPRHFAVTASTAAITDVSAPFTLYAATKHGTAGVAEAIAAELREKQIGSTIIYPGLVNTNIWDAARARPARFGGAARMPETVGDYWRAAPGPEVLVRPVFETIAAGGGRCVIDISGDVGTLFDARTRDIAGAFKDWQA